MAKIIDEKTKNEKVIDDGSDIEEACGDLGVPFSCSQGICGACMINVSSGEENLSELTDAEKDMMMDKTHRLACQCKIKSGSVEIGF